MTNRPAATHEWMAQSLHRRIGKEELRIRAKSRVQRGFAELLRRKVFRVAAAYLVVAWLLVQVAATTFEPLGLPAWTLSLVIALLVLGFPLACVLAWVFDLTPAGIERSPGPQADPVGIGGNEAVTALPAASPAPESVAILPFADMSPSHDQEYFCDGMAEEIINALCVVRGLRVASRTSSFQYKGRAVDVREIGRQLGVGSVLEGSVRKADDRVRITVQLLNAADGYHLWSQSYERKLEDVFAVQIEIAQRMVDALRVSLSPRETELLGRGGTHNGQAYDYFLKGQQLLRAYTFALLGDRDRALQLLNRAVSTGRGNLRWIERDDDLATLRDDARYKAIIARLRPASVQSTEKPAGAP